MMYDVIICREQTETDKLTELTDWFGSTSIDTKFITDNGATSTLATKGIPKLLDDQFNGINKGGIRRMSKLKIRCKFISMESGVEMDNVRTSNVGPSRLGRWAEDTVSKLLKFEDARINIGVVIGWNVIILHFGSPNFWWYLNVEDGT